MLTLEQCWEMCFDFEDKLNSPLRGNDVILRSGEVNIPTRAIIDIGKGIFNEEQYPFGIVEIGEYVFKFHPLTDLKLPELVVVVDDEVLIPTTPVYLMFAGNHVVCKLFKTRKSINQRAQVANIW